MITVAALSSGFTSAYASSHYSENWKTRKRFLKVSLAVDRENQMFLASMVTQYPTYDTALANTLLKQSCRTRKAACYVMDKGYDYKWI